MGTLKRGAKVGKVRILKKIGEGQFAEVYKAYNKDSKVAVKVDKKTEVKSLNREIQILKRLQKKQYFCKMLDYGRLDDGRSFCVMELLGGNLAKLQQFEILGWRDRLLASKELLMGIKELHVSGYIHRDIKPANIALRSTCNAGQSKWALFDFGLGRKIIGTDGVVFKERTGIGFRGSVSYASVNAHDEKDLSFHDDLWSWMYILVELLTGILPWKYLPRSGETSEADREKQIAKLKRDCQGDPKLYFPGDKICPSQIKDINQYLSKLEFGDMPNYSFLEALIDSMNANPPDKEILCDKLDHSCDRSNVSLSTKQIKEQNDFTLM